MANNVYTVPRNKRIQSDVVVIGSGAAGLRAAIALHEQGVQPLVIGKRPRADAHTVLAAGGINAALGTMDSADSWVTHAADTLHEGHMLSDPEAVEILCRESPAAINDLITYGVPFARGTDGRLLQRYFGAHRYRRTCFVGDYTGRAMIEALVAEIDRRNITVLENIYVTDILLTNGQVSGVLGFKLVDGTALAMETGAVVLAAGGHIHIYRRSSSRRRENTGDGIALALRAGAQVADMELVQFHPTGMVWPEEAEGTLVTEAVRGEGGRLYNAKGERYMAHYDAERMELSTRDRVALANYLEIVEGRGTPHGGVWLDISHMPATTIQDRLPKMVQQFQTYGGIDIARDPMEVAPTAHYSMGGVRVEPYTHSTGVPGLYAAGETTAGVHGANRLGGNSLVECMVFGRRAGEAAAAYVVTRRTEGVDTDQLNTCLADGQRLARTDRDTALALIDDLQQTMWQHAGMVRDAEGLSQGLRKIHAIREQQAVIPQKGAPRMANLSAALDLKSMLLSAEATVLSALMRTESRGAHQRRDCPDKESAWQQTIVATLDTDEVVLSTAAIAQPAPEITQALEEYQQLTVAGRLLE
ncbi:MAG: FAD-dependent oxidoreductase [Chloroflexota bacterium]